MHYSPRNPFRAEKLPTLAKLHRWGFRQGRPQTLTAVRGAARLAFYAGKFLTPWIPRGTVSVDFGEERRTASFDARNRMFSVLYFDQFKDGVEPTVRAIIDLLVPDNGVLYDIGANWGFHSLTLASRPGFSGHIHAFEPLPSTYRDLSGLVEQLRLSDVVTCHHCAIGRKQSTGKLAYRTNSGTAHLTENGRGTEVEIRSLDQLDLEPPVMLKVDTEGHEEAVFRGAEQILRRHRPLIVFEHRLPMLEGDAKQLEALEYLESLGYRLYLPQLECAPDRQTQLQLIECHSSDRQKHPSYPDLLACHVEQTHRLRDDGGIICVVED